MSKLECEKGFYDNGELMWEEWFLDGKRHNEEGPAIICYKRDGSVEWEEWWLNGKRHNEEGPAIICYMRDGSVWREEWYLNGVRYSEEEWKDLVFRRAFEEQVL